MSNAEHTPGRMEGALLRLGTAGELMALIFRGGRLWMLPMVAVLIVVGLALVFTQSIQYIAPFVYMVF